MIKLQTQTKKFANSNTFFVPARCIFNRVFKQKALIMAPSVDITIQIVVSSLDGKELPRKLWAARRLGKTVPSAVFVVSDAAHSTVSAGAMYSTTGAGAACCRNVLDHGSMLDVTLRPRVRSRTSEAQTRQDEVVPTPPLPQSPPAQLVEREQFSTSRKPGCPGQSGFLDLDDFLGSLQLWDLDGLIHDLHLWNLHNLDDWHVHNLGQCTGHVASKQFSRSSEP